jgi:hypothetical protein
MLEAIDILCLFFFGLPALFFFLSFLRLAIMATWESIRQMNYRTFKVILNVVGFLWFFWILALPWWAALIGIYLCNLVASAMVQAMAKRTIKQEVNAPANDNEKFLL